jgi:hypothetical protein
MSISHLVTNANCSITFQPSAKWPDKAVVAFVLHDDSVDKIHRLAMVCVLLDRLDGRYAGLAAHAFLSAPDAVGCRPRLHGAEHSLAAGWAVQAERLH